MKKMALMAILAVALSPVFAQDGKLMVGATADVSFPIEKEFRNVYSTGYGVGAWIQYGPSETKALSFTASYSNFTAKGSGARVNSQVGILPLMAGLRQTIKGKLYIEPQAGWGWYFFRNTSSGVETKKTESAVMYAVATGIVTNDFDFSVRYQAGRVAYNSSMGFISARIGYLLHVKKSK